MAQPNVASLQTERIKNKAIRAGLWNTLQHEIDTIRHEEANASSRASQAQVWLEKQIRTQDCEKLQTLLKVKLGVVVRPMQTPEEVDGLWFGVERHYEEHFDEDTYETQLRWELYLYRHCDQCGGLRPALALGDHGNISAPKKIRFARLRSLGGTLAHRQEQ